MVIYLRNETNDNLFEVEFWEDGDKVEFLSRIYTINCFKHIAKNLDNKTYINAFIDIFEFLEKLDTWYYEIYINSGAPRKLSDILEMLRIRISDIASLLQLQIIED
jgi:hypothetical protein